MHTSRLRATGLNPPLKLFKHKKIHSKTVVANLTVIADQFSWSFNSSDRLHRILKEMYKYLWHITIKKLPCHYIIELFKLVKLIWLLNIFSVTFVPKLISLWVFGLNEIAAKRKIIYFKQRPVPNFNTWDGWKCCFPVT